jgi:hypothetical protein
MPPNELRRGVMSDWSTDTRSMARDIEDAIEQWFGPFPPIDPKDRRKFCLAVAHGVLNHLRDHSNAMRVTVRVGNTDHTGTVTSITVT